MSRVPPPSVAINKGREEQKFNSQLTAGRPLTSRARPTFVIRGRRRRRRPSSATAPVPRTTAASGRIIALKGALVEKQRQTERERDAYARLCNDVLLSWPFNHRAALITQRLSRSNCRFKLSRAAPSSNDLARSIIIKSDSKDDEIVYS